MLFRLTEIGPKVSLESFLPTSTSFPQGNKFPVIQELTGEKKMPQYAAATRLLIRKLPFRR